MTQQLTRKANRPGPASRLGETGVARFLDALAETASVAEASRRAGVARGALYRRRAADGDFAAAWTQALRIGIDALYDEAVRRATVGDDKPVFYRGEQVATVRQTSDRLLMFLLSRHRPASYAPQYGDPGMPGDRDEDDDDDDDDTEDFAGYATEVALERLLQVEDRERDLARRSAEDGTPGPDTPPDSG
jgi:hypothetical protein